MIPFDFRYYMPSSAEEAISLFRNLDGQGILPMYYGGGTEIISLARLNQISTGAVIDIKGIPECSVLKVDGSSLIIGAAITLTQLVESNHFPLLARSAGRVADHTIRDKITIGGNIAGKWIYREAVLPLLLSDTDAVVASENGLRTVKFRDIFERELHLLRGEFLLQIIVDKQATELPFAWFKQTQLEKIGYPLVTAVANKKDHKINLALTGLCRFPFRAAQIENALNQFGKPLKARIEEAVRNIPAPVIDDIHGSADYRLFVLRNTLADIMVELEGA